MNRYVHTTISPSSFLSFLFFPCPFIFFILFYRGRERKYIETITAVPQNGTPIHNYHVWNSLQRACNRLFVCLRSTLYPSHWIRQLVSSVKRRLHGLLPTPYTPTTMSTVDKHGQSEWKKKQLCRSEAPSGLSTPVSLGSLEKILSCQEKKKKRSIRRLRTSTEWQSTLCPY